MRWFALFAMVLTGCVTHLPPNQLSKHRYEDLPWAPTLDDAQALGVETDRPVLLVLAAGALDGLC